MAGRASTLAIALALAAAALFAAAAIGQTAPTRAEYVSLAESVCKASKSSTEPLLKGIGKDLKKSRLAPAGQALTKAARLFAAQRTRLAAIPKPPADAAKLSTWLKQLDTQNSLMATAGRLMREERKNQVQGYLARYAHAGNIANDTVLGFGFNQCLFRLGKLPSP
jgi:hypothetical protein